MPEAVLFNCASNPGHRTRKPEGEYKQGNKRSIFTRAITRMFAIELNQACQASIAPADDDIKLLEFFFYRNEVK